MGLGGNLLWTPIIEVLSKKYNDKVLLCFQPELTDLLSGKLYNSTLDCRQYEIFYNNPFIQLNKRKKRGKLSSKINKIFDHFLHICHLDIFYGKILAYLCRYLSATPVLHIDNPFLSYAAKELPDRYIWKKGGHAIDIIAGAVGLKNVSHQCRLYFSLEERERVQQLISQYNLSKFITIEPNTNIGYYGNLRAWGFKEWQEIVNLLNSNFPEANVVQVGVKGSDKLDNVIPVTGLLSFRETCLLIKKSTCFLGTEGGLMHGANAVESQAVIVWGGTTLPDFTGYPEYHQIICKYVDCSPCGLKGQCPNDHKCMKNISVDDVWPSVESIAKAALHETF